MTGTKDGARRVELRLRFENVTPPMDVNRYLSSMTYTDEEGDKADDLQLTFDDGGGAWLGGWLSVSQTEQETGKKQESVVSHTVKKGDTLWAIAKKYLGDGKKYTQIASENNIKNPNLIYPGQVFKITVQGANEAEAAESGNGGKAKFVSATIVQKNWTDDGRDAEMDCGTFEIDGVDASGPPTKVTLKGTSVPYASTLRTTKKNRAWGKCSLKLIAEQLGKEAGLDVQYLAASNPTYKRKEQVQKSDVEFLQQLCKAAGLALKVTMMTLVVYDEEEYDGKPSVMTIRKGSGDYISYKFKSSLCDTAYASCRVSYTDPDTKETIVGAFAPAGAGAGQVLEVNEQVASTEEANLLAKKRLREKNANQFTASFSMLGDVRLVAGVTVMVKGFGEFDGKYRVSRAVHKLTGGYTVDIELKRVLEGY